MEQDKIIPDYKGTRQTPIRSIRNQFLKPINRVMPTKKSGVKEPKGSGGGGKKNKKTSFTHRLSKNIKQTDWHSDNYNYYNGYRRRTVYCKTITISFNKKQHIGAIVMIGRKRYRVVA